jgi:hypothetical protein
MDPEKQRTIEISKRYKLKTWPNMNYGYDILDVTNVIHRLEKRIVALKEGMECLKNEIASTWLKEEIDKILEQDGKIKR